MRYVVFCSFFARVCRGSDAATEECEDVCKDTTPLPIPPLHTRVCRSKLRMSCRIYDTCFRCDISFTTMLMRTRVDVCLGHICPPLSCSQSKQRTSTPREMGGCWRHLDRLAPCRSVWSPMRRILVSQQLRHADLEVVERWRALSLHYRARECESQLLSAKSVPVRTSLFAMVLNRCI